MARRIFGARTAPDAMEASTMRVPHFAMRSFAAVALTAFAAGCGGGDSSAPDAPFDAAGTTSDVGAMEASFESPALEGYAAASAAISSVLGESPAAAAVRAAPTKALIAGDKRSAGRYAAALARAYVRPAGGIGPSLSTAAAILDEHLGVTFVYDPETGEYAPSDAAGAPSDGVRFLVYAVDPISGVPVEPLVEVGYADIVTTESASAATVRVELVSGGVTYLDYAVGVTGNTSAVTVDVAGFVTNGDERVNFDLDNHLTSDTVVLDYSLIVPTRGNFRIDFEGEGQLSTGTVTTALEARGPHGTVTIEGTQSATTGSYEVEVNGALFATITVSEGEAPVIEGADGEPLTEAELNALAALAAVFTEGFGFFAELLAPIGG
jgi:hypothetical protein